MPSPVRDKRDSCALRSVRLTALELLEPSSEEEASPAADRATAQPPRESRSPPQVAQLPAGDARLRGEQGHRGGCQRRTRSVLLLEEVRLRSHMGRAGEGRRGPVSTQGTSGPAPSPERAGRPLPCLLCRPSSHEPRVCRPRPGLPGAAERGWDWHPRRESALWPHRLLTRYVPAAVACTYGLV